MKSLKILKGNQKPLLERQTTQRTTNDLQNTTKKTKD